MKGHLPTTIQLLNPDIPARHRGVIVLTGDNSTIHDHIILSRSAGGRSILILMGCECLIRHGTAGTAGKVPLCEQSPIEEVSTSLRRRGVLLKRAYSVNTGPGQHCHAMRHLNHLRCERNHWTRGKAQPIIQLLYVNLAAACYRTLHIFLLISALGTIPVE